MYALSALNMAKKNNRNVRKERFNIIAKEQIQDEIKKSQKRVAKKIYKTVLSKIDSLSIAKQNANKSMDIVMGNPKNNAPKGYVRRRDKKIIDAIKKRKRKGVKIISMDLD